MLIDWFTIGAQLVNFAILVWLLKRLLYRRVLRAMDERRAAIEEEVRLAGESRREAEREAENYAGKLAAFETEHTARMREASEEIRAYRSEQLARVREDLKKQRAGWDEALERQKRDFAKELRGLVGEQICEASRKMVRDLADVSLERQILVHFVSVLVDDPDKLVVLDSGGEDGTAPLVVETTFPLDEELRREVRGMLSPRLAEGRNIRFEEGVGDTSPGVVFRTGSHRLEWTVDSYVRQMAENVDRVLAADSAHQRLGKREGEER